jgi:hypothetical protein
VPTSRNVTQISLYEAGRFQAYRGEYSAFRAADILEALFLGHEFPHPQPPQLLFKRRQTDASLTLRPT